MIVRIFQRNAFNIEYSSSILVKHFHHCHNVSFRNIHESIFSKNRTLRHFSVERNFSRRENISLHRQMHIDILKKPLLCQTSPVLASTVLENHGSIVSISRQYSDSAPTIINETITYNNGIWRMISESLPVECITEALKMLHYQTGLPWWATIVLTTILMRALINLPLSVLDHQGKARMQNLKHELKAIEEKLVMEAKMNMMTSSWNSLQAKAAVKRALHEECKYLYERDNCHPFKSVAIVFLQAPIWICSSFALRNICYMLPERDDAAYQTYLELATGGFGWIKDLTDADPTLILPILYGVSGLAIIEANQLLYNVKDTKFTKYYTHFLRALTIFFVFIMAYVPSSLALFWATHHCCTLLQTLFLLSPKIRRLGRIPKTDFEYSRPYLELYKRLKGKVYLK